MSMTLEEYEPSDLMAENEFLRKQLAEALKHRRMFECDYEARLRADMTAMLTEIQLEIEESKIDLPFGFEPASKTEAFYEGISTSSRLIQEKINALRGNVND